MPSSTGQETLSQGQPPSDPLTGKRKYRAFLFSLTALALLAAGDMLSPEFVQGLAWILGLFGLGNGIEWVAGAYREKKT